MKDKNIGFYFTKRNIIIGIVLILIISLILFFACGRKKNVEAEKIIVAQSVVNLSPNETFVLNATVYPSNADQQNLKFISEDPQVATVSESGVITGVSSGITKIIVKTADNKIVAECEVNIGIDIVLATGLVLEIEEVQMVKGTTTLLKVNVTPETARIPELTYSSNDTSIVTVDENGYLTAVNEGEATITVTGNTGSGNITATKAITVVADASAVDPGNNNGNNDNNQDDGDSIVLNQTEITLEVGGETRITANTVTSGTAKRIDWSSSDSKIATIDNTGKIVAIKEGITTIVAKFGKAEAIALVIVKSKPNSNTASGSTSSGSNDSGSGGSSGSSSSNSGSTSNVAPVITVKFSGTKGNNDWYKTNVQVTASVKNASELKYCLSTNGNDCTPNKVFSTNSNPGTTLGGGKWIIILSATNPSNNKTTTVKKYVNIDTIKPTCNISVSNSWQTSKGLTLSVSDNSSGIAEQYTYELKSNGTQIKTTYARNTGTYYAYCKDKAGNFTVSQPLKIVSRTEYRYKSCLKCKTKSIIEYSSWVEKSRKCYASDMSILYSKTIAEKSNYLFFYSCVKQSGTGNGCIKGQFYCRYNTRTKTKDTTIKDCISGCDSWSTWSAWSTKYVSSYANDNSRVETETRTTFNKG